MPVHTYVTQVAIGATVDNIMDGTPYLYLPRNAVMRIYAAEHGAALPGTVLLDVMAGSSMLSTPAGIALPTLAAVGQGPDKNRHLVLREIVRGGIPLVIRIRNTDAAAIDPAIIVEFDYV